MKAVLQEVRENNWEESFRRVKKALAPGIWEVTWLKIATQVDYQIVDPIWRPLRNGIWTGE